MNIVLVDDSELIRAQLSRLLSALPGVRICGVAAGEAEAILLVARSKPDLVVLDIALSPGSGLNVLKSIRASGHPCTVLVLSNQNVDSYRQLAKKYGADAYYDKTAEIDELIEHVRSLLPQWAASEAQRLAAVDGIKSWDASLTLSLERLVALAARITGAPMAALGLVGEDTVFYKAAIGLDFDEQPRHSSACHHAIEELEVLEVPDARLDDRFAAHPLVQAQGGMRFYAGAVLRLPEGLVLGTLCIFDHVPRTLTADQRDTLVLLAQQAAADLALGDRLARLEHRQVVERRAQAHLGHLSLRDGVTGLPNRAGLMHRMDQSIRAARRDGHSLGLFLLAVDASADTPAGGQGRDQAMAEVANRLAVGLRESDVVARASDDALAVVLCRVDSKAVAATLAGKLLTVAGCPLAGDRLAAGLTVHVGVALFPVHASRAGPLMQKAELALSAARASLGEAHRVYDDAMAEAPPPSQPGFADDVRRAMKAGEIHIAFQPQWFVAGQRLSGVEALVRWSHHRLGAVSPAQFIPMAEEHGLIDELSQHIYDRALGLWSRWKARRPDLPRLALNLSAVQVQPGLVGALQGLLDRHGLVPEDIELELTETAVLSDGPAVLQTLDVLRSSGYSIAIDDFGVGYSSLAMLQRLPISALKIDRSFIGDIERSVRSLAIVEAVAALGKSLGLRLVAEGVEREEQRAVLQRLGCCEAQGYLVARPLSEEAFMPWLERQDVHGRGPAAIDAHSLQGDL